MKTLSTALPDILGDMPRDRPAPVVVPKAPSAEPVTTRQYELSEYELEHDDLERFDLEDEIGQFQLGFDDLEESEDGPLTDDGFWARTRLIGSEAGMATAEYAIATLAAVGLAGLLVVILRSEEVRGFLLNLIRTALSLP
ncbi:hypothetical protein J3A64_000003 [Pseudarthrobacter sp. PvP004]|jgi:hypothetical protein|uniref:DUF4244 domain-containing protein n=1 Tax=Paenarthrobacter aurescens (strain TC1) TaxID=290340 RepID=A1R9X8_PAEAT|nr:MULTISPECIES: DUF4244 domain-containing protein [Micrococcaceae]ABM07112.1 hypothetical protein AAur_3344 [Paenarthrobacter aurescens TC1]MBP2264539.1 hypothetical protein [Pseudarthrobacter sp. PvP004]